MKTENCDTLTGLEMPEKSPNGEIACPCSDCPHFIGTYTYFDDRTGERWNVEDNHSDEDYKHLETREFGKSGGEFVDCDLWEHRDVPVSECSNECDRCADGGGLVSMTADQFRSFAFLFGLPDPKQNDYSDVPFKDKLEEIKRKAS